jgi:hypothetical protein
MVRELQKIGAPDVHVWLRRVQANEEQTFSTVLVRLSARLQP